MSCFNAWQAARGRAKAMSPLNVAWAGLGVYTRVGAPVDSSKANMADARDNIDLMATVALGLTYFYLRKKQNDQLQMERRRRVQRRRWWMIKIHQNRTREFIEEKFAELLHEPSGEFENFCRMSYTDFEFLLSKISPLVSKQDTDFREAIPAKFRLAMTLRFLASGDNYRSLHYLFKVSKSSLSRIIREVCRALNKVIKDEVKMPTTEEGWLAIERGYRRKFPHCVGSLDGKHIVIENPFHSGTEFYNYKKTFSIVLMALVDSNYNFIYADIGSQGRISDGGVFNNSLLWKKICRNELNLPAPCPLPGSNIDVPYVFIGDGAFALSRHLLKPYPGNHDLGSPKRRFNQCLSRSRVVVENTFGILTAVFRIFRRPIDLDPDIVSELTMTCVLLHNFLRKSKVSAAIYAPQGSFDAYDSNDNLIRPGSWRSNSNAYNAIRNLPNISQRPPLNAIQIREEFTSYFCKSTST